MDVVEDLSPQKNGTKSITENLTEAQSLAHLPDISPKHKSKNEEASTKKSDTSNDTEGMKLRRSNRNRSRSTTPETLKTKLKDDVGGNKKEEAKSKENLQESSPTQTENGTSRTQSKKNDEAKKAQKKLSGDADIEDDALDCVTRNEKKGKKSNKKNVDDKSSSKKQTNLGVIVEEVETSVPERNGQQAPENGKFDCDSVEMEPLIMTGEEAEPEPELQFDETSDLESGKNSPVIIQRCKTRRSYTRNAATPKSLLISDSDCEKEPFVNLTESVDGENSNTPEILQDTNDSIAIENISTKAHAGSDVTRLNYISNDTSTSIALEDVSLIRERSLDTLRGLSPRRPIRPLNDSYRLRAIRNNQLESENEALEARKRKRRSSPEEVKRFRTDTSPSISSYLPSPFSRIKGRFSSNVVRSSTPELTAYKDEHKDIHHEEAEIADPEKRNWCSIM